MNTHISWKSYAGAAPLPKLLTLNDILRERVNKEAEVLEPEIKLETPEFVYVKEEWSLASLYAFGRAMLP